MTGCLSVTGPEIRMPEERLHELGPRVRDAGWAISEILGATATAVERAMGDLSPGEAARSRPGG